MVARAADSILVLVDVQERLAAAMEPAALAALKKNAGILIQAAAWLDVPMLATEQYPKGLGRTVAELAERLPPSASRIEKTCFSCAGEPSFTVAVQRAGRAQIVLAGMEAHVCVLQSALDLHSAGFEVFVAADACCSRSTKNHRNAMDRMRAAGVIVTNTESTVFEWLRDAGHERFKAVSALVR